VFIIGVKKEMECKKIPVECYSRVVGYYRPVNQFNKGKQEEFQDRKEFNPGKIKEYLERIETY
jgi:hypothetical protein